MANYIEKFESWTPASGAIWEEKDLGASPFNVPSGAIAEIVIKNATETTFWSVGIRPSGSILDRRINIEDANPSGGQQHMTMHVPLESGTVIEHYAQDTTVEFELVGYWTKGVYIATSEQFALSGVPNLWLLRDLDSFGVQDGDIAEIVVSNNDKSIVRTGGVRACGSTLERKIILDHVGVSGPNSVTMMVRASGANATIQGFGSDNVDITFDIVGYWRLNPLVFIERFMDLGSGATSGWESRDLSGSGIASKSVIEATLLNQEFDINTLGIRTSGSVLNRFLILTDVLASGASQALTMHTQTTNTTIETFIDDISKDHQFLLLGSWEPTPINDSIVLFMEGHDFVSSGVDLVTLGVDVYSSGLDLFISNSEILSSGVDLVTQGGGLLVI